METVARIRPKKAFIFGACMCLSMGFAGNASAAEVLAGWYDFTTCTGSNPCENSGDSKTADVFATGITATLYGGDGTRETSSNDGTFGPTFSTGAGDSTGNGGTNNYAMVHRPASPDIVLYFTVTNNTGFDVVFETLDFDAAKFENGDPLAVSSAWGESLEHISGDLDNASQDGETRPDALALAVISNPPETSDWTDLSFDFTGFGDVTLADGESTVFGLFVSQGGTDASPTNAKPIAIDNIGLIGTIRKPSFGPPEPVPALGGLGLGLLALLTGLLGVRGVWRERR
jgi:hypothetical protein